MGNVVVGGLINFIFFNAHFLSVNVFQGEGGCEVGTNCELFYYGVTFK